MCEEVRLIFCPDAENSMTSSSIQQIRPFRDVMQCNIFPERNEKQAQQVSH